MLQVWGQGKKHIMRIETNGRIIQWFVKLNAKISEILTEQLQTLAEGFPPYPVASETCGVKTDITGEIWHCVSVNRQLSACYKSIKIRTATGRRQPVGYLKSVVELNKRLERDRPSRLINVEPNSPFPSCYMPQFQSEPRCTTIQMQMSCELLCKSNSFPLQ